MKLLFLISIALSSFGLEVLTDGIVKKDLGLKPQALVETYLKKDASGEFLHTMNWWNTAVACPNCGTPEVLTVISNYKIKKISETVFEVTFDIEGEIKEGVFTKTNKTEKKTFTVTHTEWGYKIDQKSQQMVYVKSVLEKFIDKLKPETATILKSMVKNQKK